MFFQIANATFRALAYGGILVVTTAVTSGVYTATTTKPAEAAKVASASEIALLKQQTQELTEKLKKLQGVTKTKSVALPAPQAGRYVKTVSGGQQLTGHYEYCERLPEECQAVEETGPVILKQVNLDMLNQVNRWVNQNIQQLTDQKIHKTEELWNDPESTAALGAGDCEDLVLLKRQMLIEQGWPASILLVTLVKQKNGDGHAVLTVRGRNSRGDIDLVLDNLREEIVTPGETEYTFLKRVSASHAGKWEDIVGVATPKVASVQ
jgi:predicted transglutaminase-like cysteine proteinase